MCGSRLVFLFASNFIFTGVMIPIAYVCACVSACVSPRTTPSQFTSEICNWLELFSTPIALKRTQAKVSMTAFNSKWKNETLAVVVRVPQTTQTLLMSRFCFAEESKEMYKYFYRTCTAIVLFGDVLVAVVIVVCLKELRHG